MVNFSVLENGYKFDLSAISNGSEKPIYRFRPKSGSIAWIDLYENKISYRDVHGTDYNFSCDGANSITKLTINGSTLESNLLLFDALVALL
jgi:hypothetical protein